MINVFTDRRMDNGDMRSEKLTGALNSGELQMVLSEHNFLCFVFWMLMIIKFEIIISYLCI